VRREFEPVLAEEHLIADEEGRRAEHPAALGRDRHGTDVACGLEDGTEQHRAPDYFRVVHSGDFRQLRVREVARCAGEIEKNSTVLAILLRVTAFPAFQPFFVACQDTNCAPAMRLAQMA
jgi:hypothetical protein